MTQTFTRGQIEAALKKMRMGAATINLVLDDAAAQMDDDETLTWSELENYYDSLLGANAGRVSAVKTFVLNTRKFPDNTVVRDAKGTWYRMSAGAWQIFGSSARIPFNQPVHPLEVIR